MARDIDSAGLRAPTMLGWIGADPLHLDQPGSSARGVLDPIDTHPRRSSSLLAQRSWLDLLAEHAVTPHQHAVLLVMRHCGPIGEQDLTQSASIRGTSR
jgi:hypothetical protein